MISSIKNNLPFVFPIAIVAVVNIIFTTFPLLNLLHYESSALNGIILSLISGISWLLDRKIRSKYFFNYLAYIASIPVIILSISTLFCQNCPIDDGIFFYLIIALPAIPVGIAIAQISVWLSTKFTFIIFILIWCIVLLNFLPELYFNPQIYFYNPIFGYFPGVIYDQNITISTEIIVYRLINLLFAAVIIYLGMVKNNFNRITQYIIISIVMFIYIISSSMKSEFNFATDIGKIKNELKGELFTEHFHIIYPDSLNEREKKLLEYNHEFYYKTIRSILENDTDQKITSIIFESGAQKKSLLGSENADVAKPWLNQIYLNFSNYKNSLKHEIAHIFSAQYSSGLFKVPLDFNPGMIEGFAMAVENNYDDYDIDYLASLAYKNNFKISLPSLFNGFSFFSSASSLSYIYAGSFIKFLASNYGWNKVKLIYGGRDFKSVFNMEIDSLASDYYNLLEAIVFENNVSRANYYFGRLPLIKKICARATAKELSIAQNLYSEEKYEESKEKFLEIYNYSGTYSALVGYTISCKKSGSLTDAVDFLAGEIEKFKNTAYYFSLELLLADFNVLLNDKELADSLYKAIIEQNPHNRYISSAAVKILLLEKQDSSLIRFMEDKDFKYLTIKNLIENNPNDNVMQMFVRQRFSSNDEMDTRIRKMIEISENYTFSSETYFKMSKIAFQYLYSKEALYFAEKALISADIRRESVINEHISKIKGLIN